MLETIFAKIGAGIMTTIVTLGSIFVPAPQVIEDLPLTPTPVQEISLSEDVRDYIDEYIEASLEDDEIFGANLPIAGQTYTLAGAGVSPSDTSITLQSFTLTQTGQKIQDSDLSDTFYITLEPGSRTRQEIVSCTTVTQNTNNAVLSGCSRGLSPITPYTASTTLRFAHSGGTQVIFSDPPQLFNLFGALADNEDVTGYWTVPDPVGNTDIANKQYVLSVVTGGAVTTDKVIVTGTAGETVAAGNLVYLDTAQARWRLVDTDVSGSVLDVILGIAQGAGTAGNAVTDGILLLGKDTNQSGLTTGANYFASSTAGGIGTATTTRGVGKAESATVLNFNPHFLLPQLGTNNSFTGNNTFTGTTTVASSTSYIGSTYLLDIGKNVHATTTTGTWVVPNGVKSVEVEVIGGGAGGENDTNASNGGGGGGAYCRGIVDVSATSTIFISIGAGGASTVAGGNTTFSTFVTAGGGNAGNGATGGTGGDCSGSSVGTYNFVEIENFDGSNGTTDTDATPDMSTSGSGGGSVYGRAGEAVTTTSPGVGTATAGRSATGYGAGGSGAVNDGAANGAGAGASGLVIIRW